MNLPGSCQAFTEKETTKLDSYRQLILLQISNSLVVVCWFTMYIKQVWSSARILAPSHVCIASL